MTQPNSLKRYRAVGGSVYGKEFRIAFCDSAENAEMIADALNTRPAATDGSALALEAVTRHLEHLLGYLVPNCEDLRELAQAEIVKAKVALTAAKAAPQADSALREAFAWRFEKGRLVHIGNLSDGECRALAALRANLPADGGK